MKTSIVLPAIAMVVLNVPTWASKDWRSSMHDVASKNRHFYAWRPKRATPGATHGEKSVTKDPKTKPGSIESTGADPNLYFWDGNTYRAATASETAAAYDQAVRERFAAVGQALRLIHADRLPEARALLIPILRDHGVDEAAATTLAVVALRESNYQEALDLVAPFLSERSGSEVSLEAALAGAMTGHVFPGQVDYCNAQIIQAAGAAEYAQFLLPRGASPGTAKASALLAYATQFSTTGYDVGAADFFRRALFYAPDNPWANSELGEIAYRAHNWREAEVRLHAAAQHSSGTFSQIVEQHSQSAAYIRSHGG